MPLLLLALLYWLGGPPVIWAQQRDIPGIPSNMGTGVTETVQDIMNRENQSEIGDTGQALSIVPVGRVDRQNLEQDPNAPNVPRWPYPPAAGTSDRQPNSDVVSPDAGPLAPQTIGVSVVAATFGDSPQRQTSVGYSPDSGFSAFETNDYLTQTL